MHNTGTRVDPWTRRSPTCTAGNWHDGAHRSTAVVDVEICYKGAASSLGGWLWASHKTKVGLLSKPDEQDRLHDATTSCFNFLFFFVVFAAGLLLPLRHLGLQLLHLVQSRGQGGALSAKACAHSC